ncbi:hypothetical protein CANCADRAFT_123500 [Tortispora caseinolytica NRRL Y-17796]|uniref:OPT family small oligopeptide transporter n=1 Tax=Tortispora caseinolytica NRRL Y-17796 TaxID=767744 RepID=A0A1E4TI32_9ASCO|nr:hypothetical protein CANCADRAFT_123500 [Tortispora caseinolytica NRRL Y-17796]
MVRNLLGLHRRGTQPNDSSAAQQVDTAVETVTAKSTETVSSDDVSAVSVEKSHALNQLEKQVSLEYGYDPNAAEDEVISHIDDDYYAGDNDEDNSPYPEVRAAVPVGDDPQMSCNTFRAWFIGFVLVTIGTGSNMLFHLHSPVFTISSFVASFVAWPIGRAWDRIVPDVNICGIDLNPGPFSIKEHTVVTVMAGVSFSTAYSFEIFLALQQFYKFEYGPGFQILVTLSMQLIGFSISGILRSILVTPASMIWPANLVSATFLTNIHQNVNYRAGKWKISRLRFYLYVMIGSFVWFWFPGVFAPFLSYFAWPTWIAPNNDVVNQLFGASSGLGLMPVSFDWNQIAGYIGSPLIPPFFTIGTTALSIILIYWTVVPAIYYTNTFFSSYLPISDNSIYDRYQQKYDVQRILTPNHRLDVAAYQAYSPLYMSTTFVVSYGMSFASIMSTVTHTILFHGKQIVAHWKHRQDSEDDIHTRLMRVYKEVPHWVYGIIFLTSFGMAVAAIYAWDTDMPIWALILALAFSFAMTMPIGIVAAITNIVVGLNVITEFIIGYVLPGRPIAMMLFKGYGYIAVAQAVQFAQNQKLGHYMKIPPRTLFAAQAIATVWSALVETGVYNFATHTIEDICSPHQSSQFTCPTGRTFFNASVFWGVIGPARMFSAGMLYHKLLFFFLVGAFLPIISWLLLKYGGKRLNWIQYIHWPVFFASTGSIPPATPYNYASWCFVGFIFNYWIKRRHFHWWAKYNYSLSSALDLGLAFGMLVKFFTISLPGLSFPAWWGVTVVQTTKDTLDTAIRFILEPGVSFGLTVW